MAAPLTQRQTLIKFFAFSVALLVAPVLMQYRGLEALEAALGAPLVRKSENRVYASAALSFSTCMVLVVAFIVSALLESRPATPPKKTQ